MAHIDFFTSQSLSQTLLPVATNLNIKVIGTQCIAVVNHPFTTSAIKKTFWE